MSGVGTGNNRDSRDDVHHSALTSSTRLISCTTHVMSLPVNTSKLRLQLHILRTEHYVSLIHHALLNLHYESLSTLCVLTRMCFTALQIPELPQRPIAGRAPPIDMQQVLIYSENEQFKTWHFREVLLLYMPNVRDLLLPAVHVHVN